MTADNPDELQRGEPGILESVDIDTSHFMGNFPESAELHALQSSDVSFPSSRGVSLITTLLR